MKLRVSKLLSAILSVSLALPLPLAAANEASSSIKLEELQAKLDSGEINLNQYYVAQIKQYILVLKNLKANLYNSNSFSSPTSPEKVLEVSSKLYHLKTHFEQTMANQDLDNWDGVRYADTVNAFFVAFQFALSLEAKLQVSPKGVYTPQAIKAGSLSEALNRWSITFPNGIYYWTYDSISQVPKDMKIVVSKPELETKAPTTLSLNMKAVWTRYMEALTSLPPKDSYLDVSKCWLSMINITKYGESLEALGKEFSSSQHQIREFTEDEKKLLAQKGIKPNVTKPVCLGLNHKEMFEVALEVSKGGNSNSNVTAIDVKARELFKEAVKPSLSQYISEDIKKLATKVVLHPKMGRRTTAFEALPYLILEPKNFVDLHKVVSTKSTEGVEVAVSWLNTILEPYAIGQMGVADLFLSKEEYIKLENAFLEAAKIFKASHESRYFQLASHDSFIGTVDQAVADASEFTKATSVKGDRYDLRLLISEIYNYQYALEFYINNFPHPLTQLLDGDYSKADGYLMGQIHYLVKSLSLQFVGQEIFQSQINYESESIKIQPLDVLGDFLGQLEMEAGQVFQALGTNVTATEHFANDYYSNSPRIQDWFSNIKSKMKTKSREAWAEEESKYQLAVIQGASHAGSIMDSSAMPDQVLYVRPKELYKAATHFIQVGSMERQYIDLVLKQQSAVGFSGGHDGEFVKQKQKFDEILAFYKSEMPTSKKQSTNMFARFFTGNDDVSDEGQSEYNNLLDLYMIMGFQRKSDTEGKQAPYSVVESDIKAWFEKHHHEEKYEAFVALYRFYLRQSYVAQHKILDMPIRPNGSETYVPLYSVLAKDGISHQPTANQSSWIRYAVGEVQARLSQKLQIIAGAEKIEDLALFITETSVINRILGQEIAPNVRATLKLNSETVGKDFESYTMFHNLAQLHYHQKAQEKMKAHLMTNHELITMSEHAFYAPIIGDLGISTFAFLAQALGPVMKPITDFFSQVFNTQEDHMTKGQSFGNATFHGSRFSVGFLEIWILSRILPFKFAKPLRRFSAANSAVVSGHMAWFLPVIGGSLIYKNFFYRPTLEEKYAELSFASFTEVKAGIHSYITAEEADSNQLKYRGEVRTILKENYMHGAFVGFIVLAGPISRAWQHLKYNELPIRKIKSMNASKDPLAAVLKEEKKLQKRVVKDSKKFQLEFHDLRLPMGEWNPQKIYESISLFRRSPVYSELQKVNAERAYETLITHLNENINLYSQYNFLMNMRAKAFWGEANPGYIQSVERQMIELSQRRVF